MMAHVNRIYLIFNRVQLLVDTYVSEFKQVLKITQPTSNKVVFLHHLVSHSLYFCQEKYEQNLSYLNLSICIGSIPYQCATNR